ncbi:cell wall-binding repeat-containing protein [Rossellomorea aquimaris]|uniref:Putative cell wall-binding protein n=1 Tax=Rossellomorea aquimaris TaxID=189382 RepID=A0A366EK94_9BACI|nr:cell wall-binding repeat-containing protein [Rossellomorea aquimaris]RBP02754.1 putative cell wall-binding protein [Rossellomorea aquimaris]
MKKWFIASVGSAILASSLFSTSVLAESPSQQKMELLGYDREGFFVEEEPNNTFAQANNIIVEDALKGTLPKDDIDMYKIQVDSDDSFFLYGGSFSESPRIQLDVTLYDENKKVIQPLDTSSDEMEGFYADYSIAPGTYYMAVKDTNNIGSNEEYAVYTSQFTFEPYVDRIYGDDRYDTALQIAMRGWEFGGAEDIILATGENFPDALAGAPLAYHKNAPILLTKKGSLHPAVEEAIFELGVKRVTILGGTGVISKAVEDKLKALDVKTMRISGSDRYETAVAISKKLPINDAAVVVSGKNYPDALSVASIAAQNGYPILLSAKDSTSASTLTQAKLYPKNYVVGGTGVISNSTMNKLNKPTRIAGGDRYLTNAKVIKEFDVPMDFVFVATGTQFADALTGSALAAYWGEPLLLTTPHELHPDMKDLLKGSTMGATMLGGPKALNQKVEDDLWSVLEGNE